MNIISTTIATEIVRKVHYIVLTIEYKNMHYLLAKEYGEYITNNNIYMSKMQNNGNIYINMSSFDRCFVNEANNKTNNKTNTGDNDELLLFNANEVNTYILRNTSYAHNNNKYVKEIVSNNELLQYIDGCVKEEDELYDNNAPIEDSNQYYVLK